jgi:hypothetical protein
MPINSDEVIRHRRERVALLLAKGATNREIATALEVKQSIVNNDIRWLNNENEKKMFEMARQTIPTLYQNCLLGLNELIKQCWNMYIKPNRNEAGQQLIDNRDWITPHTRVEALRLAGELTKYKFDMLQNGPAMMELKKLEQQVTELRAGIELPI